MQLKVKKINEKAIIPQYQTKGAAAFDFHAVIEDVEGKAGYISLPPNAQAIVGTGLQVAVPEGYELQIRSRSGLAAKNMIAVTNGVGTVDSDYRGEIKVILVNLSPNMFTINNGDRIAQGLVKKAEQWDIVEVNELDTTERSSGGFGSTGK